MTNSNDDPIWDLRRLSRPVTDLLAQPLSAPTRARQTALLVAASLALLLSTGLVKVAEVGVGVTKLVASDALRQHIASWIAFAVTAYLLIIYLLDVWAEWMVANMRQLSDRASLDDFNKAMQARLIEGEKVKKDRIASLSSQVTRILAEMNIDPPAPAEQAPSDEPFRLSEPARAEELARRLADAMQSLEKEPAELPADLVSAVEIGFAYTKKMSSTAERLMTARLVLEILFPIAYALFALGWTLGHR